MKDPLHKDSYNANIPPTFIPPWEPFDRIRFRAQVPGFRLKVQSTGYCKGLNLKFEVYFGYGVSGLGVLGAKGLRIPASILPDLTLLLGFWGTVQRRVRYSLGCAVRASGV